MRTTRWILVATALSACGGNVVATGESGGYAGGQAGMGGEATGPAGQETPESGVDCGPEEVTLAEFPDVHTDSLWLHPTDLAVTVSTLYVAFHDTGHMHVDRIYALPRCGGTPQLIASGLQLPPTPLSAFADAYAVTESTEGHLHNTGALLRLTPAAPKEIEGKVNFPTAVHAARGKVYFLDLDSLWRVAEGVKTRLAYAPGSLTGLTVDGTHAYTSYMGMTIWRTELSTGKRAEFAKVTTHVMANDAARVFACEMQSSSFSRAIAIAKADGKLTEIGECSDLALHGDSLFLGTDYDGVQELSLKTLKPIKKWGENTSAVAVDEHHVYWASVSPMTASRVWRSHR